MASYKAKLEVNDTVRIVQEGSDIHEGNDCGKSDDQSCRYYNYLEIVLYTF